MGSKNLTRRKLAARLNGIYKPFYTGTRCYYCQEPAGTVDHVPPLSLVYARGSEYFSRKGIPLVKVSCCSECNSLLGNKDKLTLDRRARFIYDRLLTRYKRQLYTPLWEDDEMDELGDNLRSYIQNNTDYKAWIERRLAVMEDLHRDVL